MKLVHGFIALFYSQTIVWIFNKSIPIHATIKTGNQVCTDPPTLHLHLITRAVLEQRSFANFKGFVRLLGSLLLDVRDLHRSVGDFRPVDTTIPGDHQGRLSRPAIHGRRVISGPISGDEAGPTLLEGISGCARGDFWPNQRNGGIVEAIRISSSMCWLILISWMVVGWFWRQIEWLLNGFGEW